MPTRRRLIQGALGALLIEPATAVAQPHNDARQVEKLLAVEGLAIAGYRRVLATGALSHREAALARKILDQELAHERALQHSSGLQATRAPLQTLGSKPSSAEDALRLLLGFERIATRAYFEAISKLTSRRLVVLAAEILSSEAQHTAALGAFLHPGEIDKALPEPFVDGRQ